MAHQASFRPTRRPGSFQAFALISSVLSLTATLAVASPNPTTLQRIRENVFQITVLDSNGQPHTGGTGFFITPVGHAVTNLHVLLPDVLRPGYRAVAQLSTDEKECKVEICYVEQEKDIAVLRVMLPPGFQPSGLPLAEGYPVEGTDVWAAGFPLDMGYTVTKGVVSGIRKIGQLPEDMRQELLRKGWGKDVVLLEHDLRTNPGNSGGPLFNAEGVVVAVNTLVFTGEKIARIGLSVSSTDVIRGISPERLNQRLTLAELRRMLGLDSLEVQPTWPLLPWPQLPDIPPSASAPVPGSPVRPPSEPAESPAESEVPDVGSPPPLTEGVILASVRPSQLREPLAYAQLHATLMSLRRVLPNPCAVCSRAQPKTPAETEAAATGAGAAGDDRRSSQTAGGECAACSAPDTPPVSATEARRALESAAAQLAIAQPGTEVLPASLADRFRKVLQSQLRSRRLAMSSVASARMPARPPDGRVFIGHGSVREVVRDRDGVRGYLIVINGRAAFVSDPRVVVDDNVSLGPGASVCFGGVWDGWARARVNGPVRVLRGGFVVRGW